MRILSHLFANNRAWAAEMQFAVEVLRVRAVHSWIYALDDGLLRDLGMCVTSEDELAE